MLLSRKRKRKNPLKTETETNKSMGMMGNAAGAFDRYLNNNKYRRCIAYTRRKKIKRKYFNAAIRQQYIYI